MNENVLVPPAGPTPTASGIRVVVADDSLEVRRLLRATLEAAGGVTVVGEAADGAEAVAAVDAIRPDVVVLDVAMPVMDGLQALAEIRRRHGDAVPVVVWSGFSASHLRHEALERGAVAFVEKSGDLEPLLSVLRSATRPGDGSGARPPAAGTAAPTAQGVPVVPGGVPAPPRPLLSPAGGVAVPLPVAAAEATPVPLAPRPAGDARQPDPLPGERAEPVTDAVLGAHSPGGRGWWTPTARVSLLAAALFAAIFALRQASDRTETAVAVLYVVPVALLALVRGLRGGMAGAALATGLWFSFALPHEVPMLHSAPRLVSYWSVGVAVGWAADRALRARRLSERDAAALGAANRRLAATGQQLAAANAQLTETVADLRQFTHVASHDLAEPLRTMSGFAHLVQSRYADALDDTGRQFLGHIVEGAARMQALIDDLRTYTAASQQELAHAEVDLERVMDVVRANLYGALTEKGALLVVHPLPVVPGDASSLVVVLQNLVANGIKFNTSDPPVVEVKARNQVDHVVVEVTDNGIGIPPEHRDRVFRLFQRLHTRDDYPGTGLGLAICQRIVARHHGTITLTSEPGRGTTFTLTLPARSRA